MNVYMTEEEQVEQLKKWWKQYGNIVLTIVLVVVLGVQGYYWYNSRQQGISANASAAFNGLMESVSKSDLKAISANANFIKENYADTVYASSAALLLAKQYIDEKQYPKAQIELEWASSHAPSNSLKQLAKIRLARLFLYQKQFKQALASLDAFNDDVFAPMVFELKGDIFMAEGKTEMAKKEYQQAFDKLPNPALATESLRFKLNQASDERSQLVNQVLATQQLHA